MGFLWSSATGSDFFLIPVREKDHEDKPHQGNSDERSVLFRHGCLRILILYNGIKTAFGVGITADDPPCGFR